MGLVQRSNVERSTLNILIAGGLGVAPLVFLAQKLKKEQPF